MNESAPLIVILRLIAATVPWYPKTAASSLNLSESDLMAFVEQLRQGGLIVRTDPVPGHGRGYILTPPGVHALTDPGASNGSVAARCRRGKRRPTRGNPPMRSWSASVPSACRCWPHLRPVLSAF